MTRDDSAAFAALMLGLGEVYGEPVSDVRMEIYFAALADLDIETVRAAATAHVRLSKFFPRPAELREVIDGSADDRAELAWAAVLNLVRRYGYTGTDGKGKPPAFPDEVTRRAALDMYGSWRALCAKLPGEGPELLGAAKLFKAAYRAKHLLAQRNELPPSTEEARAVLSNLKRELKARGLPHHGVGAR